ncbi:hypothetical protein V8G54_015360 [Vigna mungo]|uniref:Pectinesterase inhibitor domain-containing protein n=1 Tax=Vigna mungo TaxID=3915 RepID=A0AAQ3NIC4_VIGMU
MTLTSFISINLVISLIFLVAPIQSILSHTGLLEQICGQSPDYHLCVMTLRSSIQHRSKEDMTGFTRLTLHIMNDNASSTIEHVHKDYWQISDLEVKKALKYCLISYNRVIDTHLREALNAMEEGDYKIVKQIIHIIDLEIESCNNKFKNLTISPLRDTNRYMQNLCSVTVSVVNHLIQRYQPT